MTGVRVISPLVVSAVASHLPVATAPVDPPRTGDRRP